MISKRKYSELFAAIDSALLPSPTKPKQNQQQQQQQKFTVEIMDKKLLGRIATFTEPNWFSKPRELSPVVCAQRGWENCGVDTLVCCGGCGGRVVVRFDDVEDVEEVKKEFLERLSTSHNPTCIWRKTSEKSTYKFPILTASAHINALQTRYTSIFTTIKTIPSIIAPELVRTNYDTIIKLFEFPEDFSKNVFLMALGGWEVLEGGSGTVSDVVGCRLCMRKVGLWNFRVEGGDDDHDKESFEIVGEHKWFCPWISGPQPGWKIVVEDLLRYYKKNKKDETANEETVEVGKETEKVMKGTAVEIQNYFSSLLDKAMPKGTRLKKKSKIN